MLAPVEHTQIRNAVRLGAVAGLLTVCLLGWGASPASAASEPLFARAGSLTAGRTGAASALLPNGMVLVAGGGTTGASATASAELFDPTTGVSSALPAAMGTARAQAAAAVLANGEVLIAGGQDAGGTPLASAELFDPGSDTFTRVSASMTTARTGAVAARLPNGEVLIAGGANAAHHALSSAELFNPSTVTFSALRGTMSAARDAAVAAPLPSGAVLIAGGVDANRHGLQSAELFNPGTQTFSSLQGSMTTVRQAAAAAALGDGSGPGRGRTRRPWQRAVERGGVRSAYRRVHGAAGNHVGSARGRDGGGAPDRPDPDRRRQSVQRGSADRDGRDFRLRRSGAGG